jgi:tetratricopeptide (TPR) repeat protein
MSTRAIIAAVVVVVVGVAGLILMLTSGRGHTVYVPDDAARHREKGEFLLNKRRHTTNQQEKAELLSSAIEEFKSALKSKPDFEVAYNMLGHCYIERGQWEDALKNLDKALELRTDYPAARFNRARVYQRLSVGKRDHQYVDMAIADYQTALKSELAANIVGDLHKALADAYHQKGEIQKAIEELKVYLKKSPHAQDAVLVRRKIRGLQLMVKGTAPPLSAPID